MTEPRIEYTCASDGRRRVTVDLPDEAALIHLIDALMLGGDRLGIDTGSGTILDRLGETLAGLTGLIHTRESYAAERARRATAEEHP